MCGALCRHALVAIFIFNIVALYFSGQCIPLPGPRAFFCSCLLNQYALSCPLQKGTFLQALAPLLSFTVELVERGGYTSSCSLSPVFLSSLWADF